MPGTDIYEEKGIVKVGRSPRHKCPTHQRRVLAMNLGAAFVAILTKRNYINAIFWSGTSRSPVSWRSA